MEPKPPNRKMKNELKDLSQFIDQMNNQDEFPWRKFIEELKVDI